MLKQATLFFSRATPNLATVIPAMDHIDKVFSEYACNSNYSPSIQTAVSLAQRTLHRYYDLTDVSDLYRIAMGVSILFYDL